MNYGHLEVVSNNLKMSFIEAVRNNSKPGAFFPNSLQYLLAAVRDLE